MRRFLRIAGIRSPQKIVMLRPLGQLPKNFHHIGALHQLSRRSFGNSQAESLLNRLRNGSITKSEVQRLIINNEILQAKQTDVDSVAKSSTFSSYGTATYTPSYTTMSTNSGGTSTAMIDGNSQAFGTMPTVGSSSIGTVTGLGSKTNPVYMRKHTGFREFLFSLFPFVFLFWMLGGFDIVKNRKQGGMGGMFGKNYSEWDETDWEDDDDEIQSEEGVDSNKNSILKHKPKTAQADNSTSNAPNDVNRKKEFFKRLGINLDDKKDKNESENKDSDNDSLNSNIIESNDKARKKKQKRVRFKDVCGCEEAKLDLQDLVDYLKNPEKYQKMGCKLPKGVLMSGPPGTGKTLLARALAGEAQVPFLATNGASFDEIFVGVGVMRVRKLFERAKEKSPCIVFIDEIDAIANTRMQMGTAHSSDSLNALLSEMDGFEVNKGIIVIAATNMPDRLDPALVRPGRFDRKVHIQPPDRKARMDIVDMYLNGRQDDTVDVELLVSDIAGFSGAELESMVNLASIEAVKQGKDSVSMDDLVEAKEVISMGRARKTLQMPRKVREVTAYHEGGHAIVSLFTKGAKPIYKATILPRGPALGFVASSNEDEFMSTKEALLAQLDTCMGGRAAEEIFKGQSHITTGASSDFSQATAIATAMVCQYGMSPRVGKVFYRSEDINKLSPELQNLINSEVKRLLDESFNRAKSLLVQHSDSLETLAQALLDKETMSGNEIRDLLKWDESQQRAPIDFPLMEFPKPKLNTRLAVWDSSENTGDSIKEQLEQHPVMTSQTELLNPQM